ENRFNKAIDGSNVFVSLDGTDCKIQERAPFDRKWYSHNFNSPGLRYRVGLSIRPGNIVWVNSGVPCGEWPDINLARFAFVDALHGNERALADKVHKDPHVIYPQVGMNGGKIKRIMARHETVDSRLKQFKILNQVFRHEVVDHPNCFKAVANIVQLNIEDGF
ncbi:hypothetical protein BJ742DRAFT_912951, partial [Cladochytrium replicatum]